MSRNQLDTAQITRSEKSVICCLIINKIDHLPELSIASILDNSTQDIIVGYIDQKNLIGLPKSERIIFINLANFAASLEINSGNYVGFDKDIFYKLVQLKWYLFIEVFKLYQDIQFLIYSDIDVIWIQNPTLELSSRFIITLKNQIQIQNFTTKSSMPQLCMGFIAIRNSDVAKKMLSDCQELHYRLLNESPRIGDDDVMTEYFSTSSEEELFYLLPQITFPVGFLANAYSKTHLRLGIPRAIPFIFHANFVVGQNNKTQLLLIVMRMFNKKIPPGLRRQYFLARLRVFLRTLKYSVPSLRK